MQGKAKRGVGVILMLDGKVLLGERISKIGNGQFGPPGGHVEKGEGWKEAMIREVREEIAIDIEKEDIGDPFLHSVHRKDVDLLYETAVSVVRYHPEKMSSISLLEPDKVKSWDWYDLKSLPENLFDVFRAWKEDFEWKQPFHQMMSGDMISSPGATKGGFGKPKQEYVSFDFSKIHPEIDLDPHSVPLGILVSKSNPSKDPI